MSSGNMCHGGTNYLTEKYVGPTLSLGNVSLAIVPQRSFPSDKSPGKDDDSSRPKSVVGSSPDLSLSFGDPLYLHPNDTSSTPIVTIKNHNKLGFIDGSCKVCVSNFIMIVDSEANQHMIVFAMFLTNVVDISNLGLTVGHPNGNQALITKIGDLKINNEVTLYDVLVVPEYIVSLLSVHKVSRDSELFVGFDKSNCYIQDLKANRTVGIGKQYNGLYLFDVDNACKIVSNNCIASSFVSKTLWHQRLGHPADQVLDVLKTTFNLDSHSNSDQLCDTCNKAKQTSEPFP
ncbi:ribonuclease H-like domain-containing protein [Tanacetum coccineum]